MDKEPDSERRKGVTIDLSAAIGEAGHEVEDLGFEDTPDTGELVTHESDDDASPADRDVFAAGFPVPIDGEPHAGNSEPG